MNGIKNDVYRLLYHHDPSYDYNNDVIKGHQYKNDRYNAPIMSLHFKHTRVFIR